MTHTAEAAVSVAVIDDEAPARQRVLRMLRAEPIVTDVIESADGEAAVEMIVDRKPDIVFLDVHMPGLDGFGVIDAVGVDRMPAVVFTTGCEEYAVRAFEFNAADYLLKPFTPERFRLALERAVAKVALGSRQDGVHAGASLLRNLEAKQNRLERLLRNTQDSYLQRLLLKAEGRMMFARSNDVNYFKSEGNYVRAHIGPESYVIRETMQQLEAKLDPEQFLRIHRATIVNIDHVEELQLWFGGAYKVLLRDGTELSLSRGYREKMEERFHALKR